MKTNPQDLSQRARRAIALAGGPKFLADTFGITPYAVIAWRVRGRRVPAEYVPMLASLAGLTQEEIRPDVYKTIGNKRTQSKASAWAKSQHNSDRGNHRTR